MAEVVDVLLRARMEASGVEAGVGQIQKSLQGLTLPKGISYIFFPPQLFILLVIHFLPLPLPVF